MNDESRKTAYEIVAEYAQRQDAFERNRELKLRAADARAIAKTAESKQPPFTGLQVRVLSKVMNQLIAEQKLAFDRQIAEATAPLATRIAELEAQQKDMLTDGDIWRTEKLYRRGAVVTHDGTIWVAREVSSNARPGHSDAWRLMQKTKGSR